MIGPILVAALLPQAPPAPPAPAAARQAPLTTEQVTDTQPWPPAGVYRIGTGVIPPEVLKEEKPRYTAEAMKAKIQGRVEVQAIVLTDGTVGDVRVVQSLDKEFGLDEQAIAAVKKWRFNPGKKDGVAVAVVVSIEMTFTLRDKMIP